MGTAWVSYQLQDKIILMQKWNDKEENKLIKSNSLSESNKTKTITLT